MEWLRELVARLTAWIPRVWLVEPNEFGIRTTFGKHVTDTPPGWYVYIPLVQQMTKLEIVPQVVDLRSQSLRTKDNIDIVISGGIQYKIVNARKAILNIQDFDKSLQILVLGIIAKYTVNKTLLECEDFRLLEDEILKGIREDVQGWGLKIQNIFITDLAKVRNIRLLGNIVQGIGNGNSEGQNIW